jgi:hypothetical protein
LSTGIWPAREFRLNQNRLVRLQIFLNGFYAIAGIGDPDGARLAQFVMHQQFANHAYLESCFRHAPDLTGFQWLQMNATNQPDFAHARVCAGTFN